MVEKLTKSFEYMQLCLNDPLLTPLVPIASRPAVTLLWQLDERLGELARTGREPALRQIRLRWWHEQLAALTPGAQHHDPLLQQVAQHLLPVIPASTLTALVDAWEDVACAEQAGQGGLSEQQGAQQAALRHHDHGPGLNTGQSDAQAAVQADSLTDAQADSVTSGATHRGALLFAATAHLLGHPGGDVITAAGAGWAAVGNAHYAECGQGAGDAAWHMAHAALSNISYHRLPRSLAALTALARSIAARNGHRRPKREQLLVLRVGLFGR
jgi:hypothetical protein